MELFNLLETNIFVLGKTYDVSLNWIGELIRMLCKAVGVVGIGVILFSLILKMITLPFDVYQRISMRKQNLQMEANKERMEKLQKQYANDKEKYNQKLMEMYKENGISLFSSCLPMILSLVIFIVAINAFNAFAQYSNIQNYNKMVEAYNAELYPYSAVLTEENAGDSLTYVEEKDKDAQGNLLGTGKVIYTVKNEGKYFYYVVEKPLAEGENYVHDLEQAVEFVNAYPDKQYFIDVAAAETDAGVIAALQGMTFETDEEKALAIRDYFQGLAQDAVVEAYEDNATKKRTSFGWIKNIWTQDTTFANPVFKYGEFEEEAKREKFKTEDGKESLSGIKAYTNAYGREEYNIVTAKLSDQKAEANGYFILVALSIGTILLQQYVAQRSQKAQNKYSSVDGQAASQQKMTMIIMTGMFAIFSFMYSAAFSIYMITSNIFSLLSTLVINKLVDRKVGKELAAKEMKRYENHAAERIQKAREAGKAAAAATKKSKEASEKPEKVERKAKQEKESNKLPEKKTEQPAPVEEVVEEAPSTEEEVVELPSTDEEIVEVKEVPSTDEE